MKEKEKNKLFMAIGYPAEGKNWTTASSGPLKCGNVQSAFLIIVRKCTYVVYTGTQMVNV